jgi:hypothetical protein
MQVMVLPTAKFWQVGGTVEIGAIDSNLSDWVHFHDSDEVNQLETSAIQALFSHRRWGILW